MKGISTIISSVLVLAIGISVVSIYSGWAPEFAETIVGDVEDNVDQDIQCRNANLRITDAEYFENALEIDVKVSNTGTIRFRDSIQVAAINQSRIVGEGEISSLEVGSEQQITFQTSEEPTSVVANSRDCPELRSEESSITVS